MNRLTVFRKSLLPLRACLFSKSSGAWLKRHRDDPYVKQARSLNYRSRAAFKLIELDQRYDFLKRPNLNILELGSAPGGWTQVLSNFCHESSNILAIDRDPMDRIPYRDNSANLEFYQGDITKKETLIEIHRFFKMKKVDVILSDIAPDLIGNPALDDEEVRKLNYSVLEIADSVLKNNGKVLLKSFMHKLEKQHFRIFQLLFGKVLRVKPDSSRKDSSELYYLATRYRDTEFYKKLKEANADKAKLSELYGHYFKHSELVDINFDQFISEFTGKDGNAKRTQSKGEQSSSHTTIGDINLSFFEKYAYKTDMFKELMEMPITIEEAHATAQKEHRKKIRQNKTEKINKSKNLVKDKLLDLDEEIEKYKMSNQKDDEAELELERENTVKPRKSISDDFVHFFQSFDKRIKTDFQSMEEAKEQDDYKRIKEMHKQIEEYDEKMAKQAEYDHMLNLFHNDTEKRQKIVERYEKEENLAQRMEDRLEKKKREEKEWNELMEKEEEKDDKLIDILERDIKRFEEIKKVSSKHK